MEDQIAKYSKEIYDVENENRLLVAENIKLKKEIEKNVSKDGANEHIDPNGNNGNEDGLENADEVEKRWEEIISELEERIEVRTWAEYFISQEQQKTPIYFLILSV